MFFRGQDFSYLSFNAGSTGAHRFTTRPDRLEIIVGGSGDSSKRRQSLSPISFLSWPTNDTNDATYPPPYLTSFLIPPSSHIRIFIYIYMYIGNDIIIRGRGERRDFVTSVITR